MIYLYRVNDELVEMVMTVAEMENRQRKDGTILLDDGRIGKRDIAAEHDGFKDVSEKNFPKKHQDNWAVAVHPSQVVEANEKSAQFGVTTFHAKDGSPQFTSLEHRRKYLKAFGFRDKSGYD